MAYFEKGRKEHNEIVGAMIERHHPDLFEAKVTVQVMVAFAEKDERTGEPIEDALKKSGWPVLAMIKINSYRDRVEGKADATLTIDGDKWDELAEEEKEALADHELQHLQVRRKDGAYLTDGIHRPKLKIRLHDWEYTGFRVIAERHGGHSQEVIQGRRLMDKHGQLLFTWAEAAGV